MRSISRKFSWNRNPPASHKTQTIRSVASGKSSAKRQPRGLTENRGDEEAAALLKTSKTVSRKQNTGKRACFPQDKGKQAPRFPSGSFAFCHFQLHNIDPDFGFICHKWDSEPIQHLLVRCSCAIPLHYVRSAYSFDKSENTKQSQTISRNGFSLGIPVKTILESGTSSIIIEIKRPSFSTKINPVLSFNANSALYPS